MHPLALYHLISTYFLTGIVPILSLFFTALYIRGYFHNRDIVKANKTESFVKANYTFNPSLNYFNFTNKVLDFLIGRSYAIFSLLQKHIQVNTSKIVTDTVIENAFQFIYKKIVFKIKNAKNKATKIEENHKQDLRTLSIESRIKFAESEFPVSDNAFWHHKERAPAYRYVSPIISDRFFNKQPVKKYMPFLLSTKTFYNSVRTGLVGAILAFVCLTVIYHPSKTFGYKSDEVFASYVSQLSKNSSVWSSNVSMDERVEKSYDRILDINGNPISPLSIIISEDDTLSLGLELQNLLYFFINSDGILTKLLLSMGIGLILINRSFISAFKSIKTGFIADMPGEFLAKTAETKIDAEKLSLAASNFKSCNWSRNSPAFVSFYSSGDQEQKGKIGAMRYMQPIIQTLEDKTQNALCVGGIGVGKTELVAKPESLRFMHLKNRFVGAENLYDSYYDRVKNRLTEKAINEGFLEEYKPLPYLRLSVGMVVMDIKCQVWKDLRPEAEKLHMEDMFFIIGTEKNEYSIDLLSTIKPDKFISFLKSLAAQMGGESDSDFWSDSGRAMIKAFADVAYVYQRTTDGRLYMRERNMKAWSLAFILELVCFDSDSELFNRCVTAIYKDLKNSPERLADVYDSEISNSIKKLAREWKTMAEATKSGIQATMSRIMNGYNNSKLTTFLTGVGENIRDIREIFNMIVAVNLDMDKFGNTGKLITLFIKTIIYEEAIKRQIRFSRRTLEIINEFRSVLPNHFKVKPAPELIPYDVVSDSTQKDISLFIEMCMSISESRNEQWFAGQYVYELNKLANESLLTGDVFGFGDLTKEAMKVYDKIYSENPRFKNEYSGFGEFNPVLLNNLQDVKDIVDSFEVIKDEESELTLARFKKYTTERRAYLLALYHEYTDASTRMKRERLFFLADEFHELITYDNSSECYSDFNVWNIGRSAGLMALFLSQSKNSFLAKLKDHDVVNNFMNQSRTQFYLTTEDDETAQVVAKMAGRSDRFTGSIFKDSIIHDGEEYAIYKNYNSFVSHAAHINSGKDGIVVKSYPYAYDIFAKGEAIEVIPEVKDFRKFFSNLFVGIDDFSIPSLKSHFYNDEKIEYYVKTGNKSDGNQDNLNSIKSAFADAKKNRESEYSQYLTSNLSKDESLYTESDYTSQGNSFAFAFGQHSGKSFAEKIIVAPKHYIIEK